MVRKKTKEKASVPTGKRRQRGDFPQKQKKITQQQELLARIAKHESKPLQTPESFDMNEPQRLQKVLARAGVASRRECENLIASGRVKVNGQVERTLGARVVPSECSLHVDNVPILLDTEALTVALNKPVGIESTMTGEQGLSRFTQVYSQRLYHVGRLDRDTSGLLLLSNDGELAHRLMHPSWEITKTYVAKVKGKFNGEAARALRDGIMLEDGPAKADKISIRAQQANQSLVQIELHEGRNRIVRRMFAAVGHPVLELTRIRIGVIHLGQLKPGESRRLSKSELAELMVSVGL